MQCMCMTSIRPSCVPTRSARQCRVPHGRTFFSTTACPCSPPFQLGLQTTSQAIGVAGSVASGGETVGQAGPVGSTGGGGAAAVLAFRFALAPLSLDDFACRPLDFPPLFVLSSCPRDN